jgi:UDP-glucose 4-epimerase
MRVLVTGGAGFIASHVVDAYLRRGDDVTVLDDLSTGSRENVDPRARLIVADLRDPRSMETIRGERFDLVSHHAAQVNVRFSVSDPAADAELNVVATLRLLEEVVHSGTRQVVFASSGGAAYGEPQYAPQDEKHPVAPLSPYGCSKAAIDHYLHYYSEVHGITAVSLRYANVYGPRQREDGEAGVVAIFGAQLLRGRTVTINGSGEQTRDYVFVDDVVRANMAASSLGASGIFNVGTGIETTVNELFRRLARIIGSDVEPLHGPAKAGEQLRSVLDGRRLRELGSLPAPVELDEGLRRTVEWMRA